MAAFLITDCTLIDYSFTSSSFWTSCSRTCFFLIKTSSELRVLMTAGGLRCEL